VNGLANISGRGQKPHRWVCGFSRLGCALLAAGIIFGVESYAADSTRLIGNGTAGPFLITGRPLLSDSVLVSYARDQERQIPSFILLTNPARLVFFAPVPVGDTLLVCYSALPFSLPLTYEIAHNTPLLIHPAGQTVPVVDVPAAKTPTPFKLEINGSKTFGVMVNDRGHTQTQQGLQLMVNGQLTETVVLSAAVSDRLSDRLSSGATASRINDLDEFYADVRSPHLGARFGDLLINYSASGSNTPRRLAGAQMSFSSGGHRLRAAAGKLSGSAKATEFYPESANRGPYLLTAQRRAILPNSETVYLDGRRLERGDDQDYTIDYFNGEITFSPRIVLSELQQVRVEFEESAFAFLRRGIFAEWQNEGLSGKAVNQLAARWEADDPGAGIGFDLSPADRDTLAHVNGASLVRDAAEYVGTRNGEYILREGGASPVYEYVGPQQGDYAVRFEYVGAGRGSYVHLGGGAFGYLGPALGDYEPIITIAAPASQVLVNDNLSLSQSSFGAVQASMAVLSSRSNQFNARSHRTGWAHDLLWSSSSLGNRVSAGKHFHVSTRWRRLSDVDQWECGIETADLTRTWFLPVNSSISGVATDVLESAGKIIIDPRMSLSMEYGALVSLFDGRRDSETLELALSPGISGVFSHQRSNIEYGKPDSVRTREIWSAEPTLRSGSWKLSVGVRRQLRMTGRYMGDRFDGYELTLGLGALHITHAADRVYQITTSTSLAETRYRLTFAGPWSVSRLGLTGSMNATRVSRRRQIDNRLFLDYLGCGDLRWCWPAAGLDAGLKYSINKTGAREQTANYIPTTDGYGDYRRDDNIFVPDPAGDYTLVVGLSGELLSSAIGQKEFTVHRNYGRSDDQHSYSFRDIAAELNISRREQVDPDAISISMWAIPWGRLKTPGSTADYLLLGQEISGFVEHRFPTGKRFWYLRGRYRERFDKYGTGTLPATNRRQTWELSARGILQNIGWENWEVLLVRGQQTARRYAGLTNVDIISYRGECIGSYRPSIHVQLSSALSLEHVHDQHAWMDFLIYGLAPATTLRFGPRGDRGSLKTEVEYRYVDTDTPRDILRGLNDTYSSGHNARLVVDGRLGINNSISATVNSALEISERRSSRFRLNVYAASKF